MQHVDEFIYRLPRSQRQIPSRGISLLLNIILALILIGLATILGVGVVIGIMLVN